MSGRRKQAKLTGEGRMPGDLSPEQMVARMIRVDHAGEYGAVRIYAGQLAVLGAQTRCTPAAETIAEMAEREEHHLEAFDRLMIERRVRPTLLSPLWHVAGFALGAGTALIGAKAAMACTVAVEEVIEEHYQRQAERLGEDETELRQVIEEFRAEEAQHRETALEHGARQAPGYDPLVRAIKAGSKLAIWLSERI